MQTGWKVLIGALTAAVIYEGAIQLSEINERFSYWNWAREYCNKSGKQLLRIGMKRGPFEPPNGDATLDIDPTIQDIPGGVLGDERFMPFTDKQFGVCFNEHTLEHLNTPDDVELAVNECRRVADYAVLLCPSPYSIYGTLFCPGHRLRLWFDNKNNKIVVKPNEWRTGLGKRYQGDTGGAVMQTMVLYEEIPVPAIIKC